MKTWLKNNRGFIVFLLCLGLFRTAIADWNPIPFSSMRPNLLEGDVVLVNRLAYNVKLPLTDVIVARIADPQRGDIVTFSSPQNGIRLIKRIVALPGDHVQMRNQQLWINGVAAHYAAPQSVIENMENGACIPALRTTEILGASARRIQWLPGKAAHSSFAPLVVPPGQYLMLGDNRDNSADSRYFGLVPRHLLIGRAHHLLVSADITGDWHLRTERFGQRLQ